MCSALARALQLNDTEQEHLFHLAGLATGGGRVSRLVPANVRRLIDRVGDRPMAVFDATWTILLWNPAWAALVGDPSGLREEERNVLWLHFAGRANPRVRITSETEAFDASMVADLRRSAGRYPDDPDLRRLVARLMERSEQFRDLWRRHEVAEHGPTAKVIEHPVVGRLHLDCDVLAAQRGDLRVVIYSAEPGSESDSKLALLAALGDRRVTRAVPGRTGAAGPARDG
ncbi:hypothetical protein GCM10020295_75380 [Streptomyces cinereospinus]